MKKIILGIIIAFVVSFGYFGLAHASVNDFVITDFQADYYLDKDTDGRSTLKTVEIITADFPSVDQNHGIERALVNVYDGHKTNLKVLSVTDTNNIAINYTTSIQDNSLVLRIGDANVYAHGATTYVITYTQNDVTKYFADNGDDEFYWDTNGVDWSQPFDNVMARLHLGASISTAVNDKLSCYYGLSGSNKLCQIEKGNDGLISANIGNLNPGENMTIAVGFKAGTFNPYKMSAGENALKVLAYFMLSLLPVSFIIVLVLRLTKGRGAKGRGTIVPEYLPPKGVDILLSATVENKSGSWVAATYLDLAVRHNIKIVELKKGFLSGASYELGLISIDNLSESEKLVVVALFGGLNIGTKYVIKSNSPDYSLTRALLSIFGQVYVSAKADGYYADVKAVRQIMIIVTVVTMVPAVALGFLLTDTVGAICVLLGFLGFFFGVINIMIIATMRPLSEKGKTLSDYLKGLDMYIKIAEEDRIKVLQSPTGAEKTPVDTSDGAMLVHLYERVLPYAVLFGREKAWAKVLGKYYEQQNMQPDWYLGNSLFNAAVFSSAISGLSSSAVSSYNSSSGGSGGGGFSGGGGGGGGGGGW